MRPIAISLSPNTEADDFLLALKILLAPWKWKDSASVRELEKQFAKLFGPEYFAIAVNSGRSAQYLILKALEVGRGDEVAIQAFTCVSVPNSVIWNRARPLYIDVDETINISPDDLERKITRETKAVIVQHTFGIPSKIDAIKSIAKNNEIYFIEDCAHSLGAKYKGKMVGSYGDISFFSFGRDKIISSVFGGMILTKDKDLFNKIAKLRDDLAEPSRIWILQQLLHPILFKIILPVYNFNVGKLLLVVLQKLSILSKAIYEKEKYTKRPSIFPAKMPGGLAILALNQLRKLKRYNEKRVNIANYYLNKLSKLKLDVIIGAEGSIYLRFPVIINKPNTLYLYARKNKILLGDWYKDIISPLKECRIAMYEKGSCPEAEKYAAKVINLPTYPTMSKKDVDEVVDLIKKWQGIKKK